MPTPVPEPTPAEIVAVAEITFLTTDKVSEMVAAPDDQYMADAKWALTLTDISEWSGGLRTKADKIKRVGSIEFFDRATKDYLLSFRNRILRRYEQTALLTEFDDARGDFVSTGAWFS